MKTNLVRRIVYLFLSVVFPLVFLGLISQLSVYADNLVVTTTDDGGAGSLRQAVLTANQNPGPDTITFALAPQSVITLSMGAPYEFLAISDTLTIDGGTAVSLTIHGNLHGIFKIEPGTAVTITDLTLMNPTLSERTIYNDGGDVTILRTSFIENHGGAIYNKGGEVNLQNSQMLNNKSEYGAGILNGGILNVSNTLFKNNASRYGGAVLNCAGGNALITNSHFENNEAIYIGSAINNLASDWVNGCGESALPGIVNISNGTFSGNYSGGAGTLLNDGEMNIESSIIVHNEAGYDGGGIANSGALNIYSSTISSNKANINDGGAIHQFTGAMTVSNTLVENNVAGNGGGGVSILGGDALIENSAIVSNTSASGGGVYVGTDGSLKSVMVIKNSTLSGNQAIGADIDDGGGAVKVIAPANVVTITQSTIANNAAPYQTGRDGIWQVDGSILIQQSIVADNGGENCTLETGSWHGSAHNLASDASCTGFLEADPLLTPLGDHGGSTLTHALLMGSPAVDAGDNALCSEYDQRGEPRPVDGDGDGTAVCDIGAVEMNFWPWQVYVPLLMK